MSQTGRPASDATRLLTARLLTTGLLMVAVAAVGLAAGCTPAPQEPTVHRTSSATVAPASTADSTGVGFTAYSAATAPTLPVLSGDDVAGRSITLPDLATARVTVVNVWASWCGPCVTEMPHIGATADRFRADPVEVRGLDTRDNPAAATSFLGDVGVDLPSLSDPTGSKAARWSTLVPAAAVPSTLVVDAAGLVRARWIGVVDPTELDHQVCRILTEQHDHAAACDG